MKLLNETTRTFFEAVLTILLTVTSVKGEGGCRNLEFLDCQKNKTLTGHVIKSFRILAPGLEDCQHKCFIEDKCVSYNLSPAEGMIRSCELNDADHWMWAHHVVQKEDFEYCPIKNRCSSSPCPSNKMCLPDFSWDSFSCVGCENPLGMEDDTILDSQITASSFWNSSNICWPHEGRLNNRDTSRYIRGVWAAGVKSVGEYIQVDLRSVKMVTKIATQGRSNNNQRVTKYSVSYSNDTNEWTDYRGDCVKKFPGNSDRNTVVTNKLEIPITARYIRVVVQKWHGWPSMRMELYGCTPP